MMDLQGRLHSAHRLPDAQNISESTSGRARWVKSIRENLSESCPQELLYRVRLSLRLLEFLLQRERIALERIDNAA